MPRIIGIDPGKTGGIALLKQSGGSVVYRMPTTESDLWELITQMSRSSTTRQVVAYIERVGPSPQMGVRSVWTFASNYYGVRMACIAAGIPLVEVSPLAALRESKCLLTQPPFPQDSAARPQARADPHPQPTHPPPTPQPTP